MDIHHKRVTFISAIFGVGSGDSGLWIQQESVVTGSGFVSRARPQVFYRIGVVSTEEFWENCTCSKQSITSGALIQTNSQGNMS